MVQREIDDLFHVKPYLKKLFMIIISSINLLRRRMSELNRLCMLMTVCVSKLFMY